MIEILKKICIWTIDNDELYLIIQEKKNNSLEMSALGFTKQWLPYYIGIIFVL